MDALATMIHFERRTYEQWLGQPALNPDNYPAHFVPVARIFRLGQMEFRRRSPLTPFQSHNIESLHFQLAFSLPPDMMAAFRNPFETSHCLNYQHGIFSG